MELVIKVFRDGYEPVRGEKGVGEKVSTQFTICADILELTKA
jgi:hypothetical protein